MCHKLVQKCANLLECVLFECIFPCDLVSLSFVKSEKKKILVLERSGEHDREGMEK